MCEFMLQIFNSKNSFSNNNNNVFNTHTHTHSYAHKQTYTTKIKTPNYNLANQFKALFIV